MALREDVSNYLDDVLTYREKLKEYAKWQESGDDFPLERPQVPEIPGPLLRGLQCRNHRCLLVEGGLLEQPDLEWTRMETALAAYDDWHTMNAKERDNG
jgi:hypothetical protein